MVTDHSMATVLCVHPVDRCGSSRLLPRKKNIHAKLEWVPRPVGPTAKHSEGRQHIDARQSRRLKRQTCTSVRFFSLRAVRRHPDPVAVRTTKKNHSLVRMQTSGVCERQVTTDVLAPCGGGCQTSNCQQTVGSGSLSGERPARSWLGRHDHLTTWDVPTHIIRRQRSGCTGLVRGTAEYSGDNKSSAHHRLVAVTSV